MNEEQFKSIIKKSELITSDNFTDLLMSKIEVEKIPQKPFLPSLKSAIILITIITILISFILFNINVLSIITIDFISKTHRTKLFALLLFSILIGLNYLLKTQHSLNNYEKYSN